MDHPTAAQLSQPTIQQADIYAGDYHMSFVDGVVIMVELDDLVLDMNIEV